MTETNPNYSAFLIATAGIGLLVTTLLQASAIEGYPLEQLGEYLSRILIGRTFRLVSNRFPFTRKGCAQKAEVSGHCYPITLLKEKEFVDMILSKGLWLRHCDFSVTYQVG